jgi:hypothetical protein
MWLPPFKIIKGLFAMLGQFTLSDGSDYEGPYHSTADGAHYTGSEPSKDMEILQPTTEITSLTDPYLDTHNDLKKAQNELVYPTPDGYAKGFFIRYYIQDTRNDGIVEVNEKSYKRYTPELFLKGVKVKWILEKPLKDVFMSGFLYKGAATRNIENVNKVSSEMPSLKEFITDYGQFVEVESDIEGFKFSELPIKEQKRIIRKVRPSIQEAPLKRIVPRFGKSLKIKPQSNLYTPGGRFKIKGSDQEYKGFYHIHPSKGPMEGAVHSDISHRKLVLLGASVDTDASDTATVNVDANTIQSGGTGGSQSSTGTSSGGGGGYSGGGGSGGGY